MTANRQGSGQGLTRLLACPHQHNGEVHIYIPIDFQNAICRSDSTTNSTKETSILRHEYYISSGISNVLTIVSAGKVLLDIRYFLYD